uniref:Uncharacterized protein n=1 Tax=Rhizophora mucronata TaxID=61149 RepID=A0A2P2PIZ3_RHIMU
MAMSPYCNMTDSWSNTITPRR